MKFKKIIIWLVVAIVILVGGKYSIKKYLYPYKYEEIVNKYSYEYNLDPLLVLAVIKTESNFNKDAESSKGAKGLMQIMDSTGEWIASKLEIDNFNTNMLYEPEINIEFGCWYLNNLLKEFGDLSLALAAYNAGMGNVDRWIKEGIIKEDGSDIENIPYKETNNYVRKIVRDYKIYQELY